MFDKLDVSGLNEGFDQLLTQTNQLVSMRNRKSVSLGDRADFFALDVKEVDVGRECAEEIEDVVAPIVADDTLALDRRDELNRLFLVVEDAVGMDLQCLK